MNDEVKNNASKVEEQVRDLLEPYMQIVGISQSKNTLFFQGYWRFEDAPEHAEDDLKNAIGSLRPEIRRQDEKGIVQVSLNGQSQNDQKIWLHALLFFATIITTLFAGTLMEGEVPWPDITLLAHGIPFSLTLLLILGTHELGHYITAKKHKVDATLPYFIPAPTFIGTFGAFIKMKSPIMDKKALLEIGAAGPIAGFIITIPALFIGLQMSSVVDTAGLEGSIQLGDSLFMWLASNMMYPDLAAGQDVMLHPVAFAAWIGLLVTALNLLPIGQLDGGHVAYAMFGKRHKWIAWVAFAALIPLSFMSLNWLIWALLILILIRVQHPPIMAPEEPLSPFHRGIAWISFLIFVGSFIPQPISM